MPANRAGGGLVRPGFVWLVLSMLLATALLLATSSPAMAHATLLSTTPTGDETLERAPDRVELEFDEPVEVVDGAVRVFGPDGERVDSGRVDVDGATLSAPIDGGQRGTYTVAWRALSGDSHNLSGSFVFHVGERTGATAIDDSDDPVVAVGGAFGRFLAFAGTMALFGAALIWLLSGRDLLAEDRLRLLAAGGAVAGTLGCGLVLLARAAESAGKPLFGAVSLVPDLVVDTRTGRLSAARGGLLALAALGASSRSMWRRAPWLFLILATGAMALTALAGHAWTAERQLVALSADLGHQVAAAIWIGGLLAVIVALRVTASRSELARRFSAAALVGAVVVAVTGTISGIINVGSWDALTTTGYGQLVLAKIAGFIILVTFGWLNRRYLLPIVERAAKPLLRSMRWELLVAVAVLVVTTMLVDEPPGRTSVDQPFSSSVTADQTTVQISVTPARTGVNDVHLYFFDAATGVNLPVDAVEMTAATADLPPRRLDVIPVTASHVSALSVSFPSPGEWTIGVTFVSAGTSTTTSFEVPIR